MNTKSADFKKYYFLIAVFSLLGLSFFFQVVMDDAFIFFRYGYNLVHSGIWNWSTDTSTYAEGYTSFIYAVLSILPALLHIHPYIPIKIFGVFCFIMIIRRLYLSSSDKRIGLFAILIFTANWETYVHIYSGLETILWVWLVLELVFILSEEVSQKQQIKLWIICLLLPLTRPEGILISVAAFVYLFFMLKQKINYYALGSCVLFGLVYFAWRYWYFGLLLPLTFYQKSVKNNTGIINLIINTYNAWHYIFCIIVLYVLLKKNKYYKGIVLVSLGLFFFVYSTSLLTMNYADRFQYQLFYPVILFGIISVAGNTEITKVKVKYLAVAFVVFIFGKGIYNTHSLDLSSLADNMFSEYYVSRSHLNLGLHFRKLNHPEIKVFFGDAGAFPYYANVTCYDTEGLTNSYFAKHHLTKKDIDSIAPDVILYPIFQPLDDFKKWITIIPEHNKYHYYKDIQEDNNYEKTGFVVCLEYHLYVSVNINKSSKFYPEIKRECEEAIAESENNPFRLKRFLKFKYFKAFPVI